MSASGYSRPRSPQSGETDSGSQRSERNRLAFVGLILSLVAVIPQLWLIYSFATNYDYWFVGYRGYSPWDSAALSTILLTSFVFIPGVLVILAPALVLSLRSAIRAKRYDQPNGGWAKAGVVFSAMAAVLMVVVVVVVFRSAPG